MRKSTASILSPSTLVALLLLLLGSTILGARPALAEDECPDCIRRKQGLCAEECALVPPEHALACQRDCIAQYCTHRCPSDHPALAATSTRDCDGCLDLQFNLCEENCPTGTDRFRAMCRLGCAKVRCESSCPAPHASSK